MPDLVVGYGCTIEGTVHSHGTVLIHGCVKGHTVVCSQTAEVIGHMVCERLDIAGRLNGSFDVTEALIRESAFVNAYEEGHLHWHLPGGWCRHRPAPGCATPTRSHRPAQRAAGGKPIQC